MTDFTFYYYEQRKKWKVNKISVTHNPKSLQYKVLEATKDDDCNFFISVPLSAGTILEKTTFNFEQEKPVILIQKESTMATTKMYHPLLNAHFCHVGLITFHETKKSINLPTFELPNFYFPVFWEAIVMNKEQELEIIGLEIQNKHSLNINNLPIYALRIGILKMNSQRIISDSMLSIFSRCVERYVKELNLENTNNANYNLEWSVENTLKEKRVSLLQLKQWKDLMDIRFHVAVELSEKGLESNHFHKNKDFENQCLNVWEYKQEQVNHLENPQGFIYCIYEEEQKRLSFHPALTSSVIIMIIDKLIENNIDDTNDTNDTNDSTINEAIKEWELVKEHLTNYYESLQTYDLFAGYGLTTHLFM